MEERKWENDITEGKLFDMVVNNMVNFVDKKTVLYLSIRYGTNGSEWAILQCNSGKSYLVEKSDFRKWRLNYLINKINNNNNG